MTALPPEERPPGRPDPSARSGAVPPSRDSSVPDDDVFDLLAGVIAFQASMEGHENRRPPRGHPIRQRRWRREHEVLLLHRQMLQRRLEALPAAAFGPFPRPRV